jgi:ribonucleoside-diphosphate reductase alpha chain
MAVNITENARRVLEKRYLAKDENGNVIETPEELFRRVARHIAGAEKLYNKSPEEIQKLEQDFYDIMANLEFMPNSPTLMNAGRPLGQLSACFAPEQIIITTEGPKSIKEIKEGEYVLTHKNRFRKVTKVFKRPFNREIYEIEVYKLPQHTLRVTPEHPILTWDEEQQMLKWKPVSHLRERDLLALNFISEIEDRETIDVLEILKHMDVKEIDGFIYKKNCDIRKYIRKDGSIYIQNRNRSGEISEQYKPVKRWVQVDESLLRLFGYYISEGCGSGGVLRFTFGCDEEEYCKDVIRIVEEKFGISARIEYQKSNSHAWLSVRFHSKLLSQLFLKLFGSGFDKKKIPTWILLLPPYKQIGLLSGVLRGDSCTFRNGNNFSPRIVMSNIQVMYSIWQILARLEIFASLKEETMPRNGTTLPYRCQFAGSKATQMVSALLKKEIPHNGLEWKREKFTPDAILSPITRIRKIPYNGFVYNLEVEEDHSYSANMVSVHNCFVLPIDDSLDSIFETLKATALIHKSGGGTGFDFSRLRPKNSRVRSTDGVSSGPISFMKVYNAATQEIKQGGRRRGANMGILRVDHPDILDFITAKDDNKEITNFNISVAVTDEFMKKVEEDGEYELIDPHTGQVKGKLKAREVFEKIVRQAWKNGEPGIVFIDRINKDNPTPHLGKIESTNPCGEQPLLPYESCNLGSINLAKMVKEENGRIEIDWEKLKRTTHLAVHFLDNVIDVNQFPLPQIEEKTKLTRKIGLGVMGWADMLIQLGIPYNSDTAISLAEEVMSFILNETIVKSQELAEEKGVFPAYQGSVWEQKGIKIRNATLTTIAPTGTISIIAGCSSGIEPLFALVFTRHVLDNDRLLEVNPYFEKIAKERGFYSRELMEKIAEKGSCQEFSEVPEDVKRIFVTAHDITPEWHIRMQAAFQKYIHNATSKTINFPHSATVEDVRKAYLLAYKLGCKGITIYRDKSREEQVINIGIKTEKQTQQQTAPKGFKIAPRPRPPVVKGTTTKISTGCGTLYVTINEDEDGHLFEVFMQMGKAGGCAASQLEAIGRLISMSLRAGVDPKEIINQLRGIRCPSPAWEKGGTRIFSCADAIAKVIEDRLREKEEKGELKPHEVRTPVYVKEKNIVGVCPDCGSALLHEEGCVKCMSCGYSKC